MPRRGDALVPYSDLRGMNNDAYERYSAGRYAATDKDKDNTKSAFEYKDGPVESVATPPTCPKSCKSCLEHYRPQQWQQSWDWLEYNYVYGDEQAGEIVREHIEKGRASLERVRAIIECYGNAIAKRWTKKTIPKRAALLKSTIPSPSDQRWNAAELVYRSRRFEWEHWETYHEAWLLLHLDVDTLAKDPAALLALLHVRTQHTLQEWFPFDYEQTRIPFLEGTIGLAYNPHCVVVHGEGYGDLVQWEQKAAHRGDIVGLPRAEVTFEAQEALAAFLEKTVDALLEQDAVAGNDKWRALVDIDFKRTQLNTSLASFHDSAFRAPSGLDLKDMVALMSKRVAVANDAIVQMQTDANHVRSLLRRTRNSVHLSKQSPSVGETMILHTVIRDYDKLEYTMAAHDDGRLLARLTRKNVAPRGQAMPAKYEEALQLFEISVDEAIASITAEIWDEAMLVSSFDSRCCPCGSRHLYSHPQDLYNEDRLFWCIYELSQHEEHAVFDLSFLLGLLHQTISQASRKEKATISPFMEVLLEDLAVFVRIRAALRLSRPLIQRSLTHRECVKLRTGRPNDRGWYVSCTANIATLAIPGILLEPLWALLKTPAPTGKDKNAANGLLKDIESHAALDEFWARVCESKRYYFEELKMSESRIKVFLAPISIRETRKHVARMDKITTQLNRAVIGEKDSSSVEYVKTSAQQHSQQDVQDAAVVFEQGRRESQTVWGPPEMPSTPAPTPKEKIKTRPVPPDPSTPSPEPVEPVPEQPTATAPKHEIAVSIDSLTLFRRMFDSLAASKRTACVPWDDFLAAMTDAGCGVDQKGGSAAIFYVAAKREGTVCVHRPHPDNRMNPIMLRDCGKKLTKYFGWDEESFVLRSKGDEKEKREREAWVIGHGRRWEKDNGRG